MPAGANRPLAGITVLDLGQVYVSVRGRGGKSGVSARRAQCPTTWSSARA
jgi:hypothetical protein